MIRQSSFIRKETENTIEVFVNTQIISLNKFLPSKKGIERHKSKSASFEYLADKWQKYKWEWMKSLRVFPPKKREKIIVDTIIVSDRTRLLDYENLVGGSKPIRDFLEQRGWIWNDGPQWGDFKISQRKCEKKDVGTWIKLVLREK